MHIHIWNILSSARSCHGSRTKSAAQHTAKFSQLNDGQSIVLLALLMIIKSPYITVYREHLQELKNPWWYLSNVHPMIVAAILRSTRLSYREYPDFGYDAIFKLIVCF